MKILFSASPLWQPGGLALIRMVVGLFMIYHGWEVFNDEKMKAYLTGDLFKKFSYPGIMVYLGKIAELISGLFLLVGVFTRVASLVLIFTMAYISFFVGHGKVWYEDQHPFLFVLLGLVFFFAGPGKWSVDHLLFNKTQ